MIGCTYNKFLTLKFSIFIQLVDFGGIMQLTLLAVVIVIVIEKINLCREACLLEGGSHTLHEARLLVPWHIQRGTVAGVQRLILRTHRVDVDALGTHRLDKLDEVVGIGLVVTGREMAIGPTVMGREVAEAVDLHPPWTGPGSSDDFQVGIDGKNLLQHGYHIVGLVGIESEMLEQVVLRSLLITERVFGA